MTRQTTSDYDIEDERYRTPSDGLPSGPILIINVPENH